MSSFFDDILRRLNSLERRQANLLRIGTVAQSDPATGTARVAIGALLTAPLPWLTRRAGANARTSAAPSVGEQVLVLCPSGELANGIVLPALNCAAFPPVADAANLDRIRYPDGTVLTYDYSAHKLTAEIQGSADIHTTGSVIAKIDADATVTIGGKLTASVTSDVTITAAANLTLSVTAATAITLTGATTLNTLAPVTVTASAPVAITAPAVSLTAASVSLTGNLAVTGNITATGIIAAGNPPVSLTTHNHGGSPPVAPS